MKKILVIRLSSLGDIILTTPLIKKLRQIYPDSQIDYCTKEEYSDVIRSNPNINNIIEADNELTFGRLRSLKKKLKNEKYDLIADAHNKLNTFYLRTLLKGKKLLFRKYSFRKFFFVKFRINLMKNLPPISERYLNMLQYKNNEHDNLPEIYTDQNTISKVDSIFEKLKLKNRSTICIIPSSKHYTKTYPSGLYIELINSIDKNKYSVVLIGKGNDKKNISEITSKTGSNVFDLCDKLNVMEVYELMKRCSFVICGDTGPMHAAEAAGIPIVMLSGSSVREFGFYPQSKNAIILENNELNCRPCSHIGRSSCPKGHFKCMREINPIEIKHAIESLLLIQ